MTSYEAQFNYTTQLESMMNLMKSQTERQFSNNSPSYFGTESKCDLANGKSNSTLLAKFKNNWQH